MRFVPTEREAALRARFREFFESHCPPDYAESCDAGQYFPVDLYQAAAKAGLLGLTLPVEWGGEADDAIALAILFQEVGRAFPDFGNLIIRQSLCASAIERFGSRELQEELLPRFTSGRMHMAFALTEPTAGSDVASLSTTARPGDGAYAVNGDKIYATGSDVGDAMLVFARLPGTIRRDGLLALVVATDTPGVTIERLPTMGVRATGSARVSIHDAVVSADRLVGQVGDGWRILTAGLDLERVAAAGIASGAARYLLEHVTRYLRQRIQFGAQLFELEVVRHRVADLASEVDAAEMALFRTAGRMASGTGTHVEASVAKLAATETYMHVAHAAVQLEGGYGYTSDLIVQRHFRDAKMYEIGGGASDVQREIIAKGIGV